jgi:hypothetical protein
MAPTLTIADAITIPRFIASPLSCSGLFGPEASRRSGLDQQRPAAMALSMHVSDYGSAELPQKYLPKAFPMPSPSANRLCVAEIK